MDIISHNRTAWDREVEQGNEWTIPVSAEKVAAARRGEWEIYLSELKPVPRVWFPDLKGAEVLCLASGGGQQGPILAATGARVTVFEVEGWRGTLDASGYIKWWVAPADFGKGPFRWQVYNHQGGRLRAESEPFYLPRQAGEITGVQLALEP